MGTNCAPLLDKLFLYSYEADFIHWLLKKSEKKLARSSNFTCRCIDDALSLNNSKFGDFVGCAQIFWGISCEKSRFYANKIIFFWIFLDLPLEYAALSGYDIPESVVSVIISLIEGCCCERNY
jgi:hypothetical protein